MRIILILVLVVALIGAVGYYRGWFRFTSGGPDDKPNVTVSVDKDKIRQDKDKVVGKVQDLGDKAKDKVHPTTRTAPE